MTCLALTLLVPASVGAQATSTDSLVAGLSSADWPARAHTLTVINNLPALPAPVIQSIVALTKQEARARASSPTGEAFGEYILELVTAAVTTGDKSVIPAIVSLGGTGMSTGVAAFIASGGVSVLPSLDSAQLATPLDAGAILGVVGMMYSQQGAQLTSADSAALLSRLLAAASSPAFTARSQIAYLSRRIPLPDLVPLLQTLAASDTTLFLPENVYPVRRAAQTAVDALAPQWNALTPAALLDALTREQVSACAGASGALQGHCQGMSAHLSAAQRHLGESNPQAARESIMNFQNSLQQAANAGLPAATVALLSGNAARLALLLGN